MQRLTYEFGRIRIVQLKGTRLAFSLDTNEEQGLTVIRIYEVSSDGYIYSKIGIKTASIPLYCSLKSHRRIICDIINDFINLYPDYKRLLS